MVGHGKADKDKVKAMAQKIYGKGINKYSQDAIDALMVAKWGSLRVS